MTFKQAQENMKEAYFGGGTGVLASGLFIAFYVAKLQIEWFYPIMLMIIGVRYLVFQTLYGLKIYWLLGAALSLSGVFCILYKASFVAGAFIGGGTEILFSFLILQQSKKALLK